LITGDAPGGRGFHLAAFRWGPARRKVDIVNRTRKLPPQSLQEYQAAKVTYHDLRRRLLEAGEQLQSANSLRFSADRDEESCGPKPWHDEPRREHAKAMAAYESVRAEQDAFYASDQGSWFCLNYDSWGIGGPATLWQLDDFLSQHLAHWDEMARMKVGLSWDEPHQCTSEDATRIRQALDAFGRGMESIGPTPTLRELYVATELTLKAIRDPSAAIDALRTQYEQLLAQHDAIGQILQDLIDAIKAGQGDKPGMIERLSKLAEFGSKLMEFGKGAVEIADRMGLKLLH
jgi:hypothetical protein